jgi:hypothetical protein
VKEVASVRRRKLIAAKTKRTTLDSEIKGLHSTVTTQTKLIAQMKAEKRVLERELTRAKSDLSMAAGDSSGGGGGGGGSEGVVGGGGGSRDGGGGGDAEDAYAGGGGGKDGETNMVEDLDDVLGRYTIDGDFESDSDSDSDDDDDDDDNAAATGWGAPGEANGLLRAGEGANVNDDANGGSLSYTDDAAGNSTQGERRNHRKHRRRIERNKARIEARKTQAAQQQVTPRDAGSIRAAWIGKAEEAESKASTVRYSLTPVSANSHKYDSIAKRVEAPDINRAPDVFKIKVDSIEKVENPTAQAKFFRRCAELHDPDFEEVKTLFHGTPTANVEPIGRTGFLMPTHAGVFGTALYSSNDPTKAEWHCRGGRVMFLNRVAVGKCKIVSRSDTTLCAETVLPEYDSVFAPGSTPGTGGCTEYMVYHTDQMIPMYQIRTQLSFFNKILGLRIRLLT